MTTVTNPAPAFSPPYPTLQRRFLCMIYEAVLLFGVVFLADYLFDTLTQSRSALMLVGARQVWLFFVLGVYFVWFWTHGGQTLAMKTWRMRLVDRDGRRLRPARATLRYVLCWMFILPTLALIKVLDIHGWGAMAFLALAFVVPPFLMKLDAGGRFLHDRIAGTRLVSA